MSLMSSKFDKSIHDLINLVKFNFDFFKTKITSFIKKKQFNTIIY